MNIIKKMFNRIFCVHLYWVKDHFAPPRATRLGKIQWKCLNCNKTIFRDIDSSPPNFMDCKNKYVK